MDSKHFCNDLAELLVTLRARHQRNLEAVRNSTEPLTDVENARFEVGFGLMHDLIINLDTMHRHWSEGQPAYRSTEKMLEKEG